MSKVYIYSGVIVVVITTTLLLLHYTSTTTCKELTMIKLPVQSIDDVRLLFPTSPKEIQHRAHCAMERAREAINNIIALDDAEKKFNNTAQAFDRIAALSELPVTISAIEIIEYVHPDQAMREAAHKAQIAMREFMVDMISNNHAVYQSFKAYTLQKKEQLRPDQEYFLQETMADFKRAGLDLTTGKLEQVKTLHKALAALGMQFETNIATDNKTVTVTREGLAGLDDDFIKTLSRTETGEYILGTDYPTYFYVIENADDAETRKQLFIAMNNRGYPGNERILQDIIAKRDELAQLIGFSSYAHLDLDSEMAKDPEVVEKFLQTLYAKASKKADQEYALFKQHLPKSVQLTAEGKLYPWDVAYVKNLYKKQHLAVDEKRISEYFPMEHTIKGLLAIYEKFFQLRFEQIPATNFWHQDVQLIAARSALDDTLLGYLLLDLYPRPNKYNHACHATLVPAIVDEHGKPLPEVSLVIANFPKSTADKPSLLKRDDVRTFFHEFGHAMHGLLGRTRLASQSGTSVKRDFVEMPSQMLEEWLWDKEILKMVSSHYKTGEQLPDDLIENIKKLKHFDSGDWTQRQIYLASFALALFGPGADKNPHALQEHYYQTLRPHVLFWPEDHMYASFGHLTGYAARYYGYLWSKVFALDLFGYIKEHGLLDPEVGHRYVQEVIGRGGSRDPNALLKDFLGRAPNDQAFLVDLGL